MKIDSELFDLCREFIKENKIKASDDFYELGMNDLALELLEQICVLIGYYEEDEDQDELDFED